MQVIFDKEIVREWNGKSWNILPLLFRHLVHVQCCQKNSLWVSLSCGSRSSSFQFSPHLIGTEQTCNIKEKKEFSNLIKIQVTYLVYFSVFASFQPSLLHAIVWFWSVVAIEEIDEEKQRR